MNSSTGSTVIPKGYKCTRYVEGSSIFEAAEWGIQNSGRGSKGRKSSVHVLSNCHVITVTLIMATLHIYMLTVSHQRFLCMVQIWTFGKNAKMFSVILAQWFLGYPWAVSNQWYLSLTGQSNCTANQVGKMLSWQIIALSNLLPATFRKQM